jgi:hypothetical protein
MAGLIISVGLYRAVPAQIGGMTGFWQRENYRGLANSFSSSIIQTVSKPCIPGTGEAYYAISSQHTMIPFPAYTPKQGVKFTESRGVKRSC